MSMTLLSTPANPVPEGAVTGALKTSDGMELRFAKWPAPPGRKGTVCLFQGRAEFIEKYFETVRDLRARGFAVATLDWRGQGLSGRTLGDSDKGYVRSFAQYQIDLETFVNEVVHPDCPPPVFALAHSMGATVLLRTAYAGHRWFDRMVLLAPMIALPDMRRLAASRMLVRSLRLLGLGEIDAPGGDAWVMQRRPFLGNLLTSDPERYARNVAALESNPALAIGSPTVTWADAAFREMREISEPGYPGRIRQPMLVIAADQDRIVSTPAIEAFGARLRAGTHFTVPGARHELLMEQDRFRSQVFAAFDSFVPGVRQVAPVGAPKPQPLAPSAQSPVQLPPELEVAGVATEHCVLECRICGFKHHVPNAFADDRITFSVEHGKGKLTCIFGGQFTVNLTVGEFFRSYLERSESGGFLHLGIVDNMKVLHPHMLEHADPLFLVIRQTPVSTEHEYTRRQPNEGVPYVRYSRSHGTDFVGFKKVNIAKAEVPGVSWKA
jgi:lysophospholipase